MHPLVQEEPRLALSIHSISKNGHVEALPTRHKVVVIGAGFAGIQLARKLDKKLFDVLIIDKINHHQFQPLFYQVATSQIEPSSISFPIRYIFKNRPNVQVRMAEVDAVSPEEKRIHTSIGDFSYDSLVVATGCKTNFFGNAQIEQHAFTLKSTADAIAIRNHILQTFEAIVSANEEERRALLNLVIVGAGPTGVELAGAFAEIKNQILPKDFPGIDFSSFNVLLIEGGKMPLANMSAEAQQASATYLKALGVQVITESIVKSYDGETLTLNSGKTIKTKTVIWAAGVVANPLNGLGEKAFVRGKRLKVDRQSQVMDHEHVCAIGDVSYMETPLYPEGHPQVANVAINQAKNLAANLKALLNQKPITPYEYKDLGSMATIGRNMAVVDFGRIKLKGYLAWVVWMFLHLFLILSVKNRLIIFINWAWAYLTKNSSLRLILPQHSK